MVIGNGFFSDTMEDAMREMKGRSQCEVRRCVFPTVGNIVYYVSERGHLYSLQRISSAGKYITRTKKTAVGGNNRKDGGLTARLSYSPHKEVFIPLEWLVYCTFVMGEWKEPGKILFADGNPKNVSPGNLRRREEVIPPEWRERMEAHSGYYRQYFNRVADSIKFRCGISKEDAKDVAQSAFVELNTVGFKKEFSVALWVTLGYYRGFDFKYHQCRISLDFDEEIHCKEDRPYEIDLIHLQKGEKRQRYLELWSRGLTPTDIAEMCGSTISNVGSSVTRSIQFLRKYLRNEKRYITT